MKKLLILILGLVVLLITVPVLKNVFSSGVYSPLVNSSSAEKTFAFIKPDAVAAKNSGKIIDLIEKNNFEIIGLRKVQLTKNQAERFYSVHRKRPFFNDLITFMTSGPVIALALQKEGAVKAWRDLMGDTNPEKAAADTIRKLYGTDITHNATHGSDSRENALIEIGQFFS